MWLIRKQLRKGYKWTLVLSIISIIIFVCILVFLKRHPLSITKETEWAVGIYEGASPLKLFPAEGINNPVIRRSDITDVKADYIADPFMVNSAGTWCMFFEVMNSLSRQGDIGCAISKDALHWKYQRIVLDEPFHLSYPYVFQSEGQFYMIPESSQYGAIRLYRAESFPHSWKFVVNLVSEDCTDSSVFYANKTWWMLTCSKRHAGGELRLFFADSLIGPWKEHPSSPLILGDPSRTRPGGRIVVYDNNMLRFAQDDLKTYGKQVLAFTITEISRTGYLEKEYDNNPVLRSQNRGWNRHGMHHIDAHEIAPGKWVAAVDGYRKHLTLRIEY